MSNENNNFDLKMKIACGLVGDITYHHGTIKTITIKGEQGEYLPLGKLCQFYGFNPIETIAATKVDDYYGKYTHLLEGGVYINADSEIIDHWAEWNEQRIIDNGIKE